MSDRAYFVKSPDESLSQSSAARVEGAHRNTPHVVILGPETLTVDEARAMKHACEHYGARADAFRIDTSLDLRDLRPFFASATHLLIALDKKDWRVISPILQHADAISTAKIALLCLHSWEALHDFRKRIEDNSVGLLIVRTPADHARIRNSWGRVHTLLADNYDLGKSARDIARSLLA